LLGEVPIANIIVVRSQLCTWVQWATTYHYYTSRNGITTYL
jgi:hypothetical protein